MILLSIDPSSKCTGYAVMAGPLDLVDAGVLRPRQSAPAEERIRSICNDLVELIDECKPTCGVIEICSGKPGRGSRKGARASLAIYGMAVGQVRATMESKINSVHGVDEQTWTNKVSKNRRAENVSIVFPQYQPSLDKGLDAADAIGLGMWAFENIDGIG